MSEKITIHKEIKTLRDGITIVIESVDTCNIRLTVMSNGEPLCAALMDSDQAELLRYAVTDAYEDVDYWNS